MLRGPQPLPLRHELQVRVGKLVPQGAQGLLAAQPCRHAAWARRPSCPSLGQSSPQPRLFSHVDVGSQETQRGADPRASLVQGEPGQGTSARQQRGSPEPAAGSVGHRCPLTPQTLAKGKVISTDHLKLFLSRRKWQVKAGAGEGVGQAGLRGGQDGVMCTGQDDAMPPAWA